MIQDLEYYRPKTLNTALKLLNTKKKNVKILAGGTDIIPGFHIKSKRFIDTETLVDIKEIPQLRKIVEKRNTIEIGSAVTFSEISESTIIQKYLPLLSDAASKIGSTQIRNRATIAGNFVNNAPCADSVPPLLVYDAKIEIQSETKKREISLQKFLIQPYKTALKSGELVTKIIIPKPSEKLKGTFYKLGRRRGVAISRISLAILISIENGYISELRIGSGAVTPIGIRLYELEDYAKGKVAEKETFKELSTMLGQSVLEITGLRWSSVYKLPVLQNLFYQLISSLVKNEEN